MKSRVALLLAYGLWLVLSTSTSEAQISVFQNSDGTSGTITQLGENFAIYSDSHGNSGTIMSLGGGFQSYSFTSPQGEMKSGTITTFGSPTPPNNLTPAPVLPFNPHGPIMPREQVAPMVPFTPSSPAGPGSGFGTYGHSGSGGRFGR